MYAAPQINMKLYALVLTSAFVLLIFGISVVAAGNDAQKEKGWKKCYAESYCFKLEEKFAGIEKRILEKHGEDVLEEFLALRSADDAGDVGRRAAGSGGAGKIKHKDKPSWDSEWDGMLALAERLGDKKLKHKIQKMREWSNSRLAKCSKMAEKAGFGADGSPPLEKATGLAGSALVFCTSSPTNGSIDTGVFASPTSYFIDAARAVVSEDFNDDGHIDIAVASYGSDTIAVLLNNGDGSFAPASEYAMPGSGPVALVAEDLNTDGHLDIAVASWRAQNITILIGNGEGTFVQGASYAAGRPISIASGDFNKDGHPDLAVANYEWSGVQIFVGSGSGTFSKGSNYYVGGRPASAMAADMNSDGYLDIVIVNYDKSVVRLLMGGNNGAFLYGDSYYIEGAPRAITADDFNGDGYQDLAVANHESRDVTILFGQQDGVLAINGRYAVPDRPIAIATGDFDDDDIPDVIVTSSEGVGLLPGSGDGTFESLLLYAAGTRPMSLATGDFNGDGFLDVTSANMAASGVSVILNRQGDQTSPSGELDDATPAPAPKITPGGCEIWSVEDMISLWGFRSGWYETGLMFPEYSWRPCYLNDNPCPYLGAFDDTCGVSCALQNCGVDPQKDLEYPSEAGEPWQAYWNKAHCLSNIYPTWLKEEYASSDISWQTEAYWLPFQSPTPISCQDAEAFCPPDESEGCEFSEDEGGPEEPPASTGSGEALSISLRNQAHEEWLAAKEGSGDYTLAAQLTEQTIANEVGRLRPEIPWKLPRVCLGHWVKWLPHSGSCTAAWMEFCTSMVDFDSVFRSAGTQEFRFRGSDIPAGDLNYYFIGMAFAYRDFTWQQTLDAINAWKLTQRCVNIGSGEVTQEMLFSAEQGWIDERTKQEAEE